MLDSAPKNGETPDSFFVAKAKNHCFNSRLFLGYVATWLVWCHALKINLDRAAPAGWL